LTRTRRGFGGTPAAFPTASRCASGGMRQPSSALPYTAHEPVRRWPG
jgi:hypothetical protein